jgi:hypothetical protein
MEYWSNGVMETKLERKSFIEMEVVFYTILQHSSTPNKPADFH